MSNTLKNKARETLSYLATHNRSEIWEYKDNVVLRDHIAITFAAESKLIFTIKENEVVKNITENCMPKNGPSNQLHVSLTFIYVHLPKIDATDKYAIIPIIKCVNKSSPNSCRYIDHEGNSYESWEDFKTKNIWNGYSYYCLNEDNDHCSEDVKFQSKNTSILVEKVFNKKLHKFQIDQRVLQSPQSLEVLKNKLTSSEEKKIKEIVRVACLKKIVVDETEDLINFIKDEFRDRILILDRLLIGFQTITGETREYLGNVYFVRNIIGISNCTMKLTKMEVADDNQLLLQSGLKLDAKAFIQVKEKWLSYLLIPEPQNDKLKEILSAYRYTLDSQREVFKEKISKALNTKDIKSYRLNNNCIFSDLKPFEINSIHSVMKNVCHNFDLLYIELGIEFAELMQCTRVTEFCAALEYVALDLDKTTWPKIKQIKRSKDKAQLEAYEEKIRRDFTDKRNGLRSEMQTLMQKYNEYCKEGGLKFCCAMSAVYHYKKHNKIKKINNKRTLEFEEYFKMAKDFADRDVAFKWSQDGSSRCFTVFDEDTFSKTIKYQNSDGSTVIASLMFDKKNLKTKQKNAFDKINSDIKSKK